MILDRPNCFGQIQIVLVRSKLFWSDPNCFGQIQIILVGSKSFWSGSNYIFIDYFLQFGPVQNDTVQNHFCPIKGQDIKLLHKCKNSDQSDLSRLISIFLVSYSQLLIKKMTCF